MEPVVVGPMPVLRKVSVSGGSNSPRRVFGFEPSSGSTSAASRQSEHELPLSPTSFLTEALRLECSWPHGELRTGRAGFNRRSFSFPELCSLADPVAGSASSTAPIAVPVPTFRGATPKRANSSQTFFDTAFTAGGDAGAPLPFVCTPAAAPIYRSPSARFAVPRLAVMLPPVQLSSSPGMQPLPPEVMAPWQCIASAAGACAPQNSLRAELLAVRAEAATASAQLHGCQAQLVQEHELMAQLAQQLAAVQAERDRLAEQVAVLRSIPDAPLAAGDGLSAALVFDLEVPPPPLPPPLPLRALRRPGAAALEREAQRVAQEETAAVVAAPCDADARQPAVPAQQRFGVVNLDMPAGFVGYAGTRACSSSSSRSSSQALQEMPVGGAQPQRRSGFARLGLPVKGAHEDDRSSDSGGMQSPPTVPIQCCAQPRTQMLRSDSHAWHQFDSPSAKWVFAAGSA